MNDLVAKLRSRAWEDRQHRQLRALAAKRIEALEAALRKYGVHINDCPQNLLQPACDLQQRCTCGFSEVSK